jgi:hypothetical protein
MHTDPYVNRTRRERIRDRRGGGKRGRCGAEREEEGIALRIDLHPTLGSACFSDQAPVLGECLRVQLSAELVQEPGRALDVGEEEGDSADGKVGAHGQMMTPLPFPARQLPCITGASRGQHSTTLDVTAAKAKPA